MSTRSNRRFDDDDYQYDSDFPPAALGLTIHDIDEPSQHTDSQLSSYPDATHGPLPTPTWVITSANAIDDDLGVMKSGKEADVSLLRRSHREGSSQTVSVLMAVKRYRDANHRLFHRDAGYLEGRRVRRSREMRAMATRTDFGRELIAGQWARAEFSVLSRLWQMGAAVPYPVQVAGTEIMMELIGDDDGTAAPRLAQLRPDRRQAERLFAQLREVVLSLAEAGYAHADLSPYNILVHNDRLVLIDLPQAIDLVGNPHGFEYLRRDCVNVCTWFDARGIDADVDDLYEALVRTVPHS